MIVAGVVSSDGRGGQAYCVGGSLTPRTAFEVVWGVGGRGERVGEEVVRVVVALRGTLGECLLLLPPTRLLKSHYYH